MHPAAPSGGRGRTSATATAGSQRRAAGQGAAHPIRCYRYAAPGVPAIGAARRHTSATRAATSARSDAGARAGAATVRRRGGWRQGSASPPTAAACAATAAPASRPAG